MTSIFSSFKEHKPKKTKEDLFRDCGIFARQFDHKNLEKILRKCKEQDVLHELRRQPYEGENMNLFGLVIRNMEEEIKEILSKPEAVEKGQQKRIKDASKKFRKTLLLLTWYGFDPFKVSDGISTFNLQDFSELYFADSPYRSNKFVQNLQKFINNDVANADWVYSRDKCNKAFDFTRNLLLDVRDAKSSENPTCFIDWRIKNNNNKKHPAHIWTAILVSVLHEGATRAKNAVSTKDKEQIYRNTFAVIKSIVERGDPDLGMWRIIQSENLCDNYSKTENVRIGHYKQRLCDVYDSGYLMAGNCTNMIQRELRQYLLDEGQKHLENELRTCIRTSNSPGVRRLCERNARRQTPVPISIDILRFALQEGCRDADIALLITRQLLANATISPKQCEDMRALTENSEIRNLLGERVEKIKVVTETEQKHSADIQANDNKEVEVSGNKQESWVQFSNDNYAQKKTGTTV